MDEFNSSNGFEMVSIINFGDHGPHVCMFACLAPSSDPILITGQDKHV